jgi:nucleotide-binding universal stress UspA family protein
MKILVAVDGSVYTKRMLAYLVAHDEWLGAQHAYTMINVVPPLPPRAAAVIDRAVLQSHYAESSDKVFRPIRAFCERQKIDATFVAKVGLPAEVIAATATRGKFDLLMLGSHGHGALGSLVMGSVATKVMASCQTPLLIVR